MTVLDWVAAPVVAALGYVMARGELRKIKRILRRQRDARLLEERGMPIVERLHAERRARLERASAKWREQRDRLTAERERLAALRANLPARYRARKPP